MKRHKGLLSGALIALTFILAAVYADAAGSVSQSYDVSADRNIVVVTIVCTGDSSNGSIPSTALNADTMEAIAGKYLYTISAYPTAGGTPPDAADVFIMDAK